MKIFSYRKLEYTGTLHLFSVVKFEISRLKQVKSLVTCVYKPVTYFML